MKTILVPTDFSEIAKNVINYAVEIAKLTKAKIILFHAFHIPTLPTDVPYVMPLDETEKDNLAKLKKIKKSILGKKGNSLTVECETKLGFAVDEINKMIQEKKVDLVVMGMRGGGYLSEKLIGSITTSLIRKAKCPVLAINENISFKNIKKIVLACDYQKLNNKTILEPLKEFITLFNSHVYILNVIQKLKTISPSQKIIDSKPFKHALEKFKHSFHFSVNKNIVDGINEFVDENKGDMMVFLPHKHSFFETIFQERNTKRMAFHTHIPLLALHE